MGKPCQPLIAKNTIISKYEVYKAFFSTIHSTVDIAMNKAGVGRAENLGVHVKKLIRNLFVQKLDRNSSTKILQSFV